MKEKNYIVSKKLSIFLYIFCICKEEFSTDDYNKKYYKVRDHCHYTEKHRGTVYVICNLG